MKKLAILVALAMVLGCVIRTEHTINAHLLIDIRHIDEQADNVLDFIEGETDSLSTDDNGASWLREGLQLLNPVPSAYAADTSVTSPRMKQIASKLKERNAELSAAKSAGKLGERYDGYVEPRNGDADIKKLAQDENADREALYAEVVRLNKDEGVTIEQIAILYGVKRLERANAGEWIKLPPSGSVFDEFAKTPQGKKLGADCKPDAWVKAR